MVRLELGEMKNAMTTSGIEPSALRLIEQCLNQLSYSVFQTLIITNKKQTPWPLVRERTIPTDRPPLVDEI
jgi:hypothetical protein